MTKERYKDYTHWHLRVAPQNKEHVSVIVLPIMRAATRNYHTWLIT